MRTESGPGADGHTCRGVAVAVETHRNRFTSLDKQREIYACHCMNQLALFCVAGSKTFSRANRMRQSSQPSPHVPPDFPTQEPPSIPIRAKTTALLLHITQLFKTLSSFLILIVFRMKGFLSHRWVRFGIYTQVLT